MANIFLGAYGTKGKPCLTLGQLPKVTPPPPGGDRKGEGRGIALEGTLSAEGVMGDTAWADTAVNQHYTPVLPL